MPGLHVFGVTSLVTLQQDCWKGLPATPSPLAFEAREKKGSMKADHMVECVQQNCWMGWQPPPRLLKPLKGGSKEGGPHGHVSTITVAGTC